MPCSHCGQNGHNRRTCPERQREIMANHRANGRLPGGVALPTRHTGRNVYFNHRTPGIVVITDTMANGRTYQFNNRWHTSLMEVPQHCEITVSATSLVALPPILRLPGAPGVDPVISSIGQDVEPPPRPTTPVRRAPPVARKMTPKHIAEQIWELQEPDCQICLSKVAKENYALSPCGHHFCKDCYGDPRLTKCGECRVDL